MEVLQRTANRGSVSTGSYEIDNSYKNENDNTERMYRPWGGITANTRTWTVSLWVKRTELGACYTWGAGTSGNDVLVVDFDSSDRLGFRSTKDAANDCVYRTNRVFRDTSAWYHLVFAVDTTSGTAGNRLRIYVNGVEETSFATETNFDQNDLTLHNANGSYMEVGSVIGESPRFNGYIAEVNSITGTQYAPTAFGKFDEDSGIWIPIKFTGSYAENSVFLEFKDSSSLGTDTSGNGQTFTLQNLSAADQATDTPTNNFATFNVAQPRQSGTTIAEGGTEMYVNSNYQTAVSSIAVSKGKWYAEFIAGGHTCFVGFVDVSEWTIPQLHNGYWLGYDGIGNTMSVGMKGTDGNFYNDSNSASGATFGTGDIISVALDMDNRKAYWAVNGTYVNSGNPATGANPVTWYTQRDNGPNWTDVITMGITGYSNTYHRCNFGGYSSVVPSSLKVMPMATELLNTHPHQATTPYALKT